PRSRTGRAARLALESRAPGPFHGPREPWSARRGERAGERRLRGAARERAAQLEPRALARPGERAQHEPVGFGLRQVDVLAAVRPVHGVGDAHPEAEARFDADTRRPHHAHRPPPPGPLAPAPPAPPRP